MSARLEILKLFAPLLRYPNAGYAAHVQYLLAALPRGGTASAPLQGLLAFVRSKTTLELQDEYTRCFDINPAISLDIGFHLFGLAYKRGEFLVKVREALRETGLSEGTELPDHLPTLLELAAALGEERGTSLIEECVFPAIERMFKSVALPAQSFLPLAALREFLKEHFRCVVLLIQEADEAARQATEGYVYTPMELDELQTGVARHE